MTTRTLCLRDWREYRVAVLIAPRHCRRLAGVCGDNPMAIVCIWLRPGERAPRVAPESEPASDVKGAQFGMLGTLALGALVGMAGLAMGITFVWKIGQILVEVLR